MHNNDAAIIGASGAGCYAAWLLAQHGVDVCVYERASSHAVEKRLLIVTSHLGELLNPLPSDLISHRVKRFQLFSRNASAVVGLSDHDIVIDRCELISYLRDKAASSGAKFYYGHQLVTIEPSNGHYILSFSRSDGATQAKASARWVIGADGVNSCVARYVSESKLHSAALLQAIVELPSGFDTGTSYVWFRPEETRYFYWLIPNSDGCAAVGLIVDDAHIAMPTLSRFCKNHGFKPVEYQRGYVRLYDPWQRVYLHDDNAGEILLVGDAAGHVKVTTVGGTVPGLYGALCAVRTILHGGAYNEELRELRHELNVHWVLRKLLNRFRDDDYDAMLRHITSCAQGILSQVSRDCARNAMKHLLRRQPWFMFLALKTLFRFDSYEFVASKYNH